MCMHLNTKARFNKLVEDLENLQKKKCFVPDILAFLKQSLRKGYPLVRLALEYWSEIGNLLEKSDPHPFSASRQSLV